MKISWSRVYYFISGKVFEPTLAFEESVLVIAAQLKDFQFVHLWTNFKDFHNIIQTTLTLNTFIFLFFSKSPKWDRTMNSFGFKSHFKCHELTCFIKIEIYVCLISKCHWVMLTKHPYRSLFYCVHLWTISSVVCRHIRRVLVTPL